MQKVKWSAQEFIKGGWVVMEWQLELWIFICIVAKAPERSCRESQPTPEKSSAAQNWCRSSFQVSPFSLCHLRARQCHWNPTDSQQPSWQLREVRGLQSLLAQCGYGSQVKTRTSISVGWFSWSYFVSRSYLISGKYFYFWCTHKLNNNILSKVTF